MTTYRVLGGYDNPLVDLDDIVPQPHTRGLQSTRRSYGVDGSVYDEGLYVEFEFDMLESAAQYQALLLQFDLNAALYAPVTIYCRDDQFEFTRYNGIAVRPEIGRDGSWENYFARNFKLVVKDLAAL